MRTEAVEAMIESAAKGGMDKVCIPLKLPYGWDCLWVPFEQFRQLAFDDSGWIPSADDIANDAMNRERV